MHVCACAHIVLGEWKRFNENATCDIILGSTPLYVVGSTLLGDTSLQSTTVDIQPILFRRIQ